MNNFKKEFYFKLFEDASSCRHGERQADTHTAHTHTRTLGRWQPLSFVMLENRIEQLDGRVHIRVLLNRVLKHLIRCSIEHFLCAHTQREREGVGRGESAVRKQCDHYMIELCFVVPVAMLTRKIPTYTPGIASVPSSARLEVINFVRKTCCCAPGKHIMAISCQFATPLPL